MKMFNTFNGVFVPSFEAILGAVLFLILPMLTGMMGFWNMLIIVALANTATLATAFSISDCATNLERIGAGGMYAVSKRSLGKAFGGSIGIQLYLAQSVSIGFYAIGFAEPLQGILAKIPFILNIVEQYGLSPLVQKQIIGTVIALIAFVAGIAGADFIVKIQMVIFIILSVAVGAILFSPFIVGSGPGGLFQDTPNWAGMGTTLGFWGAFAAFFPAVTGIDAGVGMSGNLADPKKSLPRGTFLAIAVTFLVYIAVTYIFSMVNTNLLLPGADGQVPSTVDIFSSIPILPVLLLLGILFATGSSALSYFMTAPRSAQALAQDNLLPGFLRFLGKDFSKLGKEPRWATVFTLFIVVPIIWAGDITFISLVVGICFLVVYGWVNLAAFFERISGNPSFRPTSKGHWLISLYGFVICMVVIALFNIWVGIGVVISQLLIFMLLLKYRSGNKMEGVWWGLLFSLVQWTFHRLRIIIQGTKNWRPIVGIFAFLDNKRETEPALRMASRIADFKGLTMLNLLRPDNYDHGTEGDSSKLSVPVDSAIIHQNGRAFESLISGAGQAASPGGFGLNTVFLTLDSRLNTGEIIEEMIANGKHVILYKHGAPLNPAIRRIDVWWKGEENGNLMALLSYIINQSDIQRGDGPNVVRILRKVTKNESRSDAQKELERLIVSARLPGKAVIVEDDSKAFDETLMENSMDASLILMGMPGERPKSGIVRMFALDKLFFSRQVAKYKDFPPILFVKAAGIVELLE